MATNFSRTLRALDAEGSRRWVVQAFVAALLVAWMAWFLLGQVTVYETAGTARLEVKSAAHPVTAQIDGHVVKIELAIGRWVEASDVLLVLDTQVEQLAINERHTQREALASRLQALRVEIEAEREVLRGQQRARTVAVAEARAQLTQAAARAQLAEIQVDRSRRLIPSRAISWEEFERTKTEAATNRATVQALNLATDRLNHDRENQESESKARLAKLEYEAVQLTGEMAVQGAAIRRLQHDMERRHIRAPVCGRIGEVSAEFQVGSFVRAGEKLGAIVPEDEPRAVALFPAASIGRLCQGQPARLRLDGFPWTQYGTIPATVADVGNEATNGLVRVELSLAPDFVSPIPIEHGAPGTVEVEVETVSPVILMLRAAGQFLTTARPSSAPTVAIRSKS
jgi:membrane fusion protein (multidrug efflux system)